MRTLTRQERVARRRQAEEWDEWVEFRELCRLPLGEAVARLDAIPHGPACLCDDCLRWADLIWADCEVETLVF